MKIALCVASRGWGSYRTVAGMLREMQGVPWMETFAIGLPIPTAQNECVRKALADPDVTHLWFVEDDHVLPAGCLAAMQALLSPETPIAAVGYLLRGGTSCVIRHPVTDEPELVGLGCTLMRREVFDLLPSPPFQVHNRMQWEGSGWRDTGVVEHAGGQDVFLCRAVRAAGLRIGVVEGMQAGHLELLRHGRHENFGMDEERCWGGKGLPWYPEPKERRMAQEWWQSPSGQTVIDLDPDLGGDIDFYRQHGWKRVNKTAAAPVLKQQEARNTLQVQRATGEDDDD